MANKSGSLTMNKFKIEITETLSKIIEVEADDIEEALERVETMYKEEKIILDSSDFIDKEITLFNDENDVVY